MFDLTTPLILEDNDAMVGGSTVNDAINNRRKQFLQVIGRYKLDSMVANLGSNDPIALHPTRASMNELTNYILSNWDSFKLDVKEQIDALLVDLF